MSDSDNEPHYPITGAILPTVFQSVAILTTAYRLTYRFRTRKLSWDDLFAAIAMFMVALFLAALWMGRYILSHPELWENIVNYRIADFWINTISFNAAVWATRVSIALSLVRVLPFGTPAKKVSISMVVLFVVMFLVVMSEKGWVCGRSSEWHSSPTGSCPQGFAIAVTQLATDVISSVALVVFPLYVLWGVHLPSTERRLILSLFATSIVQTVVSTAHAVYIFDFNSSGFYITAQYDSAISLTFCNLLVIVTRFYRWKFPTSPSPTPPDPRTPSSESTKTGPPPLGLDTRAAAEGGGGLDFRTTAYTLTEVEVSFDEVRTSNDLDLDLESDSGRSKVDDNDR